MKRAFLIIFVFALIVMMAQVAEATEAGSSGAHEPYMPTDNLSWELSSEGVLTISGSGAMQDYGDYPYNAPWGKTCKQVVICDGVTSIGSSAFSDCSGLTSITISDSVTSIGSFAFRNCSSLMDIIITDGITCIGRGAFFGCTALESLTFYTHSTTFNGELFDSIAQIPLIRCYVGSDVDMWAAKKGYPVEYLKEAPIVSNGNCGDNLTWKLDSEGLLVIQGTGEMFDYDLLDYSGNGITTVPWGQEIKGIILEDGICSIGNFAFSGCTNLTSVVIPDGVTKIGTMAFGDCTSLYNVLLPDTVVSIYDYAFFGCSSLQRVNIPYGIRTIDLCIFGNCSSLVSITIPESVIRIGKIAFTGCSNLSDIIIPNSVIDIDDKIFSHDMSPNIHCFIGSFAEEWAYANGYNVYCDISTPIIDNIQIIPWANLSYFSRKYGIFKDGATASVTDLETGISYKVYRRGGYNHADVEPLTSLDTWQMYRIYNCNWSWERRAAVVTFSNGISSAASINGMPHGDCDIINNSMNGHTCIYFSGSHTHSTDSLDPEHQAAVAQAAQSNLSELQNKINFQFNGGSAIYLPASTTIIEEEAFVSISADIYVLPAGISAIASRAFADLQHPALVVIPTSADITIAPDAFAGSSVTIQCPAGSPTEAWAVANGIPTVNP